MHKAGKVRKARVAHALAVILGIAATMLVTATASAAPGEVLQKSVSNSHINARCAFDARVNNGSTITGNLSGDGSYATVDDLFNLIYLRVDCYLTDPGGTILAQHHPSANGPWVPQNQVSVTVPNLPSYRICTGAYGKLRNGTDTTIAVQCSP